MARTQIYGRHVSIVVSLVSSSLFFYSTSWVFVFVDGGLVSARESSTTILYQQIARPDVLAIMGHMFGVDHFLISDDFRWSLDLQDGRCSKRSSDRIGVIRRVDSLGA